MAGIEVGENVGRWIRPIGATETGALTARERQYRGRKEPRLLDVVDIPVQRPKPQDYQQENWLIAPNKPWSYVSRSPLGSLASHVSASGPLWVNGHHTSGGRNDQIPLSAAVLERSSLRLVHADALKLKVYQPGEAYGETKRRVQGRFRFAGEEYWLRVTDPEIEDDYLARPNGFYTIDDCYLTISVGEPFKGNCYKLIAAVIQNEA